MRSVNSRRLFCVAAAASAAGAQPASKPLTAGEVVERIQKNLGVPWRNETVDTIKTGGPDTPVKGIATTFMSTFDVLQRAAASGRNMVITHEPTFYNHQDQTKDFGADAVLKAKQDFIAKHDIVVFRFHDHWHMRRPDGIRAGMLETLGWTKYAKEGSRTLELPATTLAELASSIRKSVGARSVRVIGDPKLKVSRVALSPGYGSLEGGMRAIANSEVDVLVGGESREWEIYEYAQDAIAAGMKKGLIMMGHAVSEEGGMKECAKWLKTFIPEVPVDHVPAGEPFWPAK